MKHFMFFVLLTATACATHKPTHERRDRKFEPGEYAEKPAATRGSLFGAQQTGFFSDIKPRAVGDVLIVRVDERDSALHDSSTRLGRDSSLELGISGEIAEMVPGMELSNLLGANSSSSLNGSGSIQRRGRVQAMLPVRVKQLLPNGDLYVEGTKVVIVGNEERQLYLSGIVRSPDVRPDGSVLSSRIADAEIAYTGFGDASDQQEVGWLSKVLSWIWPF